jgi:hypothetical protein
LHRAQVLLDPEQYRQLRQLAHRRTLQHKPVIPSFSRRIGIGATGKSMTMPASATSSLVVDAGLVLAVVLPHPYREHGQRFWRRWLASPRPLLAPCLWVAEVTSGLRRAV